MEGPKHSQVAVVMIPFPEQSHLNSLLHLSNLITSCGIPVHYAGSAIHNRQAKLRYHGGDTDISTKIHFHDFQLPHIDSPPPKHDPRSPFPLHLLPLFEASFHLREPVCQLLQELSPKYRRIIVIHDCNVASIVQDVRLVISNGESYSFFGISAFSLFSIFWDAMPVKPFELKSDVLTTHIASDEGCIPPAVMKFVREQFKFLGLESGRLYNTSRVIEGEYVELLEKLSNNDDIKHFAIGPFNPVEMKRKAENDRHKCLEWLDKQETGSVIYISFGSTTSMSDEQIEELAKGLERSEEKFIWVIKRADSSNVFAEGESRRPELSKGFEDRVKNRGIVIREWAPQLEILAHRSIGGFMSHCGWNSCIESISLGMPIAAWPIHSEQPKNAILVSEVLKVGMLVRDWEKHSELVLSSRIKNVVRTMMRSEKGDKMRKSAEELGDVVRNSVAKGGVSSLEMDSFVAHITR